MVPDGWTQSELKSLVQEGRKISYGIVQPGEFTPDGVILIRGKDYSRGWVREDEFFRVSMEVDRPYKRSKVQAGDVLLTIVGEYTGNTAVVPDWLDGANITQTTARIAIDTNKASPSYVYQYLSGKPGKREVYRFRKGGAQPGLNIGDVERFQILLPPKEEQAKIANVLSTWDQAITVAERLFTNAEAQKRALMQQLLTGRRRLRRFEGTPWRRDPLQAVFRRIRRKNSEANQNVLTISGKRGLISQQSYFNKIVASEDTSAYTLLRGGEFAYNKSYSAGYPLGAIKMLPLEEEGILSSLYICFHIADRGRDCIDFYRHWFEYGGLNSELRVIAQEGARNHGLLNVGVSDFFQLLVSRPDAAEQREIAAILNNAEQEAVIAERQLEYLTSEKRALMQQLLSGERRVTP